MASDNFAYPLRMGKNRIQSFAFVIGMTLCVFLSVGFAALCLLYAREPVELELDNKINPNSAPVVSLVRLPGIGIVRAQAIVAHRENSGRNDGNSPAFGSFRDLQKVPGIGPKTARDVSKWLKFE